MSKRKTNNRNNKGAYSAKDVRQGRIVLDKKARIIAVVFILIFLVTALFSLAYLS